MRAPQNLDEATTIILRAHKQLANEWPAGSAAEREKLRRYGPGVLPLAVETYGRWGRQHGMGTNGEYWDRHSQHVICTTLPKY